MKTIVTLFCASLLLPVLAMAEDLRVNDADIKALVRGNNAFAVELYSQLKNQPGNLFFSPESISTALAMTYAGARGKTATEMANVLHFTSPPEKLHPAMGALLQGLNAAHDGYELKVANVLWGQQGYDFLPDFLDLTKVNYGTSFKTVDFKGNTELARLTINEWVEQRTEKMIKNLIAPGMLNAKTRLVLSNAIYFKGEWQTPFKKEDTKDEDFHLSAAQNGKLPMMHFTGYFEYSDEGTFQALSIPYKKNELSLIVLLPKSVDGLHALEESLTPANMQQWLNGYPSRKAILTMPRFNLEVKFTLNDALAVMGMKQAFNPKNADFTGMLSREEMQSNDGKDSNLSISAVIHKAYVDVNEEGTEAAAATAAVVASSVAGGGYYMEPPPIVFRADHPFLFLIRDNKSGSILFMGRLIDPTK